MAASAPFPAGGVVYIPAQSLTLPAADGVTFPSSLPARLHGVISAGEFGATIARCNVAFARSWQRRTSDFLTLVGLFVIILMIPLSLTNSGLFIPGFACSIGVTFAAVITSSYLEKKQIERVRATLAAENEYYNSQQRAARFGPLHAPIRFSVGRGPKLDGETDQSGNPIMVTALQIDIGGGMLVVAVPPQPLPQSQPQPLVAGPPFAQPAAYGAPPPFAGHYARPPIAQPSYAHPTYASTYAQPAQAPSYAQEGQAPPAYSSHAQAEALSAGGEFAQQLQSGQSPAAADAWTAEGQPFKEHAVASSPLAQQSLPHSTGAGSCERCGHAAHTPADRFCAACGGSIVRGT